MNQLITEQDKDKLNALRGGDSRAFGHFFDQYSQRLFFFALGYLKSEKDAEEVVQETFMKIWERRSFVNPELSFQAYLFKIAFNFIQKKLALSFRESELKHEVLSFLTDENNQVVATANYHDLLQHVHFLMGQLPPRQREVVELRVKEGFSVGEIAEKLGLAGKTIEAHLTAALKFLRQQLAGEFSEDLLLFSFFFKKSSFD